MKNLFGSSKMGVGIGSVVIGVIWGAVGPGFRAEIRATTVVGSATLARRHRCTGLGGSSRVTRTRETGGGETLRGDTDVPDQPGSAGRLHLSERATVDARGRLLAARLVAARPRAPVTTYLLQPLAARVRILREGMVPVDWPVPADAPWVYQAGSSKEGLLVSSPVAAWLAARASASAAGVFVRVLVPERRLSYLAPVDQIAVPTEKGTTVVLGADGIDVDGDFVTEARLTDRGLTLVCADVTSDVGSEAVSARDGASVPGLAARSRRGDVSGRGPALSAAPADRARTAFP
jgi:hypothetical protein